MRLVRDRETVQDIRSDSSTVCTITTVENDCTDGRPDCEKGNQLAAEQLQFDCGNNE